MNIRAELDRLAGELEVMRANPHVYTRAAVKAKELEYATLVELCLWD